MKKAVTAVTAVLLSVLLAPAAWGQTPNTSTRVVLEPPDAFLSSASGEVQGEIRVYCWRDEGGSSLCADRFDPIDPPAALSVEQGELLTLRFDRPISPTSITVRSRDTPSGYFFPPPPTQIFTVPPGNPTQFPADLPPGTHFLSVFTTWEQGDAEYVFEITVSPPESTDRSKNKEQCKWAGWQAFGFKNQGQCIRSVESQRRA